MTPKEKAEKIVQPLYLTISNNGSFTGEHSIPHKFEEAKKCGLLTVENILEFMRMDDEYTETASNANSKWVGYWLEVQEEIKKL